MAQVIRNRVVEARGHANTARARCAPARPPLPHPRSCFGHPYFFHSPQVIFWAPHRWNDTTVSRFALAMKARRSDAATAAAPAAHASTTDLARLACA
eukprot:4128483-Pleurochrysis_carterae.AAC.1